MIVKTPFPTTCNIFGSCTTTSCQRQAWNFLPWAYKAQWQQFSYFTKQDFDRIFWLLLMLGVTLFSLLTSLKCQKEYFFQTTMAGYLNVAETLQSLRNSTQTARLNSERTATKIYYRLQQLQTPENYNFYFNSVLWASAPFNSWKVTQKVQLKDTLRVFI